MAGSAVSLHGRRLMINNKNNALESNGIDVTSACVDATITVGAEAADVRQISIQLKDSNGKAIDFRKLVEIVMFADANGAAFVATGGSTGIAIGASGALLTVVAKKLFYARSTAAGLIALTWTDTGTEAAYLGVRLPNGRVVMSTALTNA